MGAATVPLLPDVVWPGKSSGNSCVYNEPAKHKWLGRSGTFMTQWFRCLTLESVTQDRSLHSPLHVSPPPGKDQGAGQGVRSLCPFRSVVLHSNTTWGLNASDLQRLCHNDHFMIHCICGTKYWDETPSAQQRQKIGIAQDITAVLHSWRPRCYGPMDMYRLWQKFLDIFLRRLLYHIMWYRNLL